MMAQPFVLRGMTTGVAPAGLVEGIEKATAEVAVRLFGRDGHAAAQPYVPKASITPEALVDPDIESRHAARSAVTFIQNIWLAFLKYA